jgi:formylglycine-generating enzyme required for sulfatase activity
MGGRGTGRLALFGGVIALLGATHCSSDSSGSANSPAGVDSSADAVGVPETGHNDGSVLADAAAPEAGAHEAGLSEAATTDAGAVDAATIEAGGGPLSCQMGGLGLTDCGPNHESCCTSLAVTGGTYNRTYSIDAGAAVAAGDPATVSSFRLDKYLVTVGRFRQFVNAWSGGSGYTPPAGSGKHSHLNGGKGLEDVGSDAGTYETGWDTSDDSQLDLTNDNLACDTDFATWTNTPSGQENLPMNCVVWWEAYAFCIWDGAFLPSEAEFEYAAAGGSEQREYPWGATDPGTAANQFAIYGCNYNGDGGSCTGVSNIAPVGSAKLGVGKWGQLDLSGDMGVWLLDWWSSPYGTPCTDCAYLSEVSGRVLRGGDYSARPLLLESWNRNEGIYPTDRKPNGGFRCARTP